MQTTRTLALAAALAAAFGPALAVDGVTLINQNKAMAGGVTPGDAPGFPVTISRPGSYRLSGNLLVPDAQTTAVLITADDVTLDLNGFALRGPVQCSYGPPVQCTPAGSGDGVQIQGVNSHATAAISNGVIRGMGRYGINADSTRPGVVLDRLRVAHNGATGIAASQALIQHVTVTLNGGDGVGGNGVNVQSSLINGNGGFGIGANFVSGVGNTVMYGNALGNLTAGGARPTSGNRCSGNAC